MEPWPQGFSGWDTWMASFQREEVGEIRMEGGQDRNIWQVEVQ